MLRFFASALGTPRLPWRSPLLFRTLLVPGEQLTGVIEELPLPLAHLTRVKGLFGGDLLKRPAITDRLYGDSGFEKRQWVCCLLMRGNPISGAAPRLRG